MWTIGGSLPHYDPREVPISLLWLLGKSPTDSSHVVFGTHSFRDAPKQRASRREHSVPRTDSGQEHWRQSVIVGSVRDLVGRTLLGI